MTKNIVFLLVLSLCLFTPLSVAQDTVNSNENSVVESSAVKNNEAELIEVGSQQQESEPLSLEKPPEVGKHVMANMNASSMILSLLMVLGVIVISALVLKRFNLTQQNSNQLKVIASVSLGAKERVVVVQIGEQQLVLGVCPQQISLLKDLDTPIDIETGKSLALSGNVLSFLQKSSRKTETDSNSATSENNK